MANKEFKVRVQMKKDTESNFKTIQSTFVPLKGEIVIVETSEGDRLKIGDGTTTFENLKFQDSHVLNVIDNLITGVSSVNGQKGKVNLTASDVGALAFNGKATSAGTADSATSAVSATKLATVRTIDGVNFDGSADIIHYGDCSTAAETAAKEITCMGFKLTTGAIIRVKFMVTNTADNPSLNVNNTGAKPIFYRGVVINKDYLAENRTYEFVYNGAQYDLVGDINSNNIAYSDTAPSAAGTASAGTATTVSRSDHVHPAQTNVSGNAGTATILQTARNLKVSLASTSSVGFNGSKDVTNIGVDGVLPLTNGGTGVTSITDLATALSPHIASSGSQIFYGSSTPSGVKNGDLWFKAIE